MEHCQECGNTADHLLGCERAKCPVAAYHAKLEGQRSDDKLKPLNCDRDAARWAREFNEGLFKAHGLYADEGWLIGWFANAMMCGEDTYRWKLEAEAKLSAGVPKEPTVDESDLIEARDLAYKAGRTDLGHRLRDALEGVRDPVLRFAVLMERELKANDHKGGWGACDEHWLLQRMREELVELERLMLGTSDPSPSEIGSEAADVANFAMMICDNLGALPTGPLTRSGGDSEKAKEKRLCRVLQRRL